MTPQCATLCNSPMPCPLFQDALERIYPVVFSKTKSLFILLIETAKNRFLRLHCYWLLFKPL